MHIDIPKNILRQQAACRDQCRNACHLLGLAMAQVLLTEEPVSDDVKKFGRWLAQVFQEMEPYQFWLEMPPPENVQVLRSSFAQARDLASEGEKTLRALIRKAEPLTDFPAAAIGRMREAKELFASVKTALGSLIAELESSPSAEPADGSLSPPSQSSPPSDPLRTKKFDIQIFNIQIDWTVVKLVGMALIIAILAFLLGRIR